MTVLAFSQLLLALMISVLAAVTDHREGKVKNKHLIVTLGAWFLIVIIGVTTRQDLFGNLKIWVANLLFACAATLILYLKDIWAPGDGKLFLLLAMIYPDRCYAARSGNLFPLLDVIVFSFAIGYLYLEINTLFGKGNHAVPGFHVRTIFKARIKGIINNLGIALSLIHLLIICFAPFYADNFVLSILIIGLILLLVQKRLPRLHTVFGIVGWIFFIVFVMVNRQGILTVILPAIQSLIIGLVIEVLNLQMNESSYREISGEDVKPGMILSIGSSLAMAKCVDPNIPAISTETRRSRLNMEQAEAVRQWCKKTKRDVIIVEMLPFAPFISIALMVEIVRFFFFYYV